jgi:hypothetical protein
MKQHHGGALPAPERVKPLEHLGPLRPADEFGIGV